jgi:hypothetical protein
MQAPVDKERQMIFPSAAISRTHLARNTRQTIEQARRGQAILVESYGEEQVGCFCISPQKRSFQNFFSSMNDRK